MKDKFSLSKSIYYIGIINYLTDYITTNDYDGYKSIYFGDGLKIRSINKICENYYENYVKGLNCYIDEENCEPKNKQYLDGVIITLEKYGVKKVEIYIGKDQTTSMEDSFKEKKKFIENMIKKPNRKYGEFLDMPKDKDIDLSLEDQKEIHIYAIGMIRYLDNRIKEETPKELIKQ